MPHILQELKQKITVDWPALAPDLRLVWNTMLEPYLAEPALLSRVKVLLVGDNPGVEEAKHSIYLAPTGRSGKEARRVLGTAGFDYDRQVANLNKSPIHTPKTADLQAFKPQHNDLIIETEQFMARCLVALLRETGAHAIIIGMAGCDAKQPGWPHTGRSGRFPASYVLPHYFAELKRAIGDDTALQRRVLITKHFSHGHFGNDLKALGYEPGDDLLATLGRLPYAPYLFAD
jgi:hypothetical protein